MAVIIQVTDLPAALQTAELIDAMVDGANAKASRVAPCLAWEGDEDDDEPAPSEDQLSEARLVLIGAISRWAEAGTGAFTQQSAGPFSVSTDTRQRSGYNLWPSEITNLQDICQSDDDSSRAFSVDTVGDCSVHLDWCSYSLGALYCSCGADIAGWPIYEGA